MKKLYLIILILHSFQTFSYANENLSSVDNLFHIDHMNSHNENFALYFKTREKAILAKGEDSNYINDAIPINKIQANPYQPRKDFNDSKMEELVLSIKEKGILQPIAVRELKNGNYEIIAGERPPLLLRNTPRQGDWRAAQAVRGHERSRASPWAGVGAQGGGDAGHGRGGVGAEGGGDAGEGRGSVQV